MNILNNNTSSYVCSRDVAAKHQRHPFFIGIKHPRCISQPVIYRDEENKYHLASFIFFYNQNEINKGVINRPTAWFVADIETGRITKVMLTETKEFSDAPYGVQYNFRLDHSPQHQKEHYETMFGLLDDVRKKLIHKNEFDSEKYGKYLEKVLTDVPEDCKRFFTDLSV